MATMDLYGRIWPGQTNLCSVCGQPEPEVGTCDHSDRGSDGLAVQKGGFSLLGQRVSVLTGHLATHGKLKDLTPDTIVIESAKLAIYRINRDKVDRVTGPIV